MTVWHEDKRRKRERRSCKGVEKDIALIVKVVKWNGSRF